MQKKTKTAFLRGSGVLAAEGTILADTHESNLLGILPNNAIKT